METRRRELQQEWRELGEAILELGERVAQSGAGQPGGALFEVAQSRLENRLCLATVAVPSSVVNLTFGSAQQEEDALDEALEELSNEVYESFNRLFAGAPRRRWYERLLRRHSL